MPAPDRRPLRHPSRPSRPIPPRPAPRPTPKPPPRPAPKTPAKSPPPKQWVAGDDPVVSHAKLNCGAMAGHIHLYPSTDVAPRRATPSTAEIYAVIGTWHEADVIEATVKNCLANGVKKVFIIDNDSPDRTCAVAEAAGAIVSKVYKTTLYDDDYRVRLVNECAAAVTTAEKLPELWWMFLDADEFPCGPNGERLLDFVRSLDPKFNIVGANAVDLYPVDGQLYRPGLHPADVLTQGMWRKHGRGVFCSKGHWKHLLFRTQNGNFDLSLARGFHIAYVKPIPDTNRPSILTKEPPETMFLFHAPIRAKEDTFRRLEALCGKATADGKPRSAGDDKLLGSQGAIKRWRHLEDIYAGNWDRVALPHCQMYGQNVVGLTLLPWRNLVPTMTTFPRWYEDPNPPTARLRLPMA